MEIIEFIFSLPSLGVGLVAGIINVVIILSIHNKNNKETKADTYVADGDYTENSRNAVYVRSYETKVKINNDKK